MKIHVLETKGDFIYSDWVDGDIHRYDNKIKEFELNKYVVTLRTEDSLNEYTQLKNMENGDIIIVTLQRC